MKTSLSGILILICAATAIKYAHAVEPFACDPTMPSMMDIDEYSEYDCNISQINDTNDLILEADYIDDEEEITNAGTLLILSVSLFTVASIVLSSCIARRARYSALLARANSMRSSKRGENSLNFIKKKRFE